MILLILVFLFLFFFFLGGGGGGVEFLFYICVRASMHRLPLFGKSRNFFKWINFGVIDQNGGKRERKKRKKDF